MDTPLRGERAERIPVQFGRSNPNFHEVTVGLSPGDRVIVSSYDGFSNHPTLTLNQP